ncbi:MAG: hypothetical protein IH591_20030, partial [Bacteroidales bacterium]|nr:hypothetical protein [Bacteroidales bacterium]
MSTRKVKITIVLVFVFLLSACGGEEATPVPTLPMANEPTQNQPQEQPQDRAVPSDGEGGPEELGYCQWAAPTAGLMESRPVHTIPLDPESSAEYLQREFLQIPVGMTWGPDDKLYIADWTGSHVVIVAPDGSMSDVGIWQFNKAIRSDGPRGIAFDSKGCLYINNHGRIFQVDISSGYLQEIAGIHGSPVGSIAISPDDELYYSDRSDPGGIYKWVPPDRSETVVEYLPEAENLVFDKKGNLYVTQLGLDTIIKVDVDTGDVTEFASGVCSFDPCFLAVDQDGDIWARAIFFLTQLSPNGTLKPYTINGVTYDGQSSGWHTAAGIAFDNQGGLYIGSYSSYLKYLAPEASETDIPVFSLTTVAEGLEVTDLAQDSEGYIYAANDTNGLLYRISPAGEREVLWDYGSGGRTGLVVSPEDIVYASNPIGEFYRINKDGTST